MIVLKDENVTFRIHIPSEEKTSESKKLENAAKRFVCVVQEKKEKKSWQIGK